ncbi:MAG: S-layer homology domain-containing protein [Synechococcales bacterium]|nr:S-layer homology domain-containing protein [Synechococcales bacterium]
MVRKRSALALLATLSLSLASCSGSFGDSLERSLSADPELQNNPNLLGGGGPTDLACDPTTLAQLPEALPAELCYPNGTVTEVTGADETDVTEAPETDPGSDLNSDVAEDSTPVGAIAIQWATADSLDQVWTFYEAQLAAAGWEIAQRPAEESGSSDRDATTLEAVKEGVRVTVAPVPSGSLSSAGATDTAEARTAEENSAQENTEQENSGQENSGQENSNTENTATTFEVSYRPGGDRTLSPVSLPDPTEEFPPSDPESDTDPSNPTSRSANSPADAPGSSPRTVSQSFTDLEEAPDELQPYLQDLAQLGVLTAADGDRPQFQPNEVVTRRDFARWLFEANNAVYGDRPSRRIRPATEAVQPAFQDVSTSDPDFDVIQGLAEAGLIPSPLSGASTTLTFRPDAPLTREELLLWKVPLDLRQSLPTATVEAVQQTWGFQDAARIDPKALQAVLADYQNADQANIRRAFGYTTLFQPKKAVTRAEAAATLWFFGYQGDGISAAQVEADGAESTDGTDGTTDTTDATPNTEGI